MKNRRYFIQKYLENRPAFFSFIRPQEAIIFYGRRKKMKSPILDYGCGDGFFASIIFEKKFIDVGLDLPSSRIGEAKKLGFYGSLITYTGNTIPFNKNHFGTIISNCVFEHILNIKRSLQEMHQVLKNDGLLMTSVMCSSWNDNLRGGKIFGKKYIDWFNKIQHNDSLLSKEEWANLFKKCGYKIIESIDYLYEEAAQKTEIYHFLSFFSLITYVLFKRWKLSSFVSKKKIEKIEKLITKDTKNPSACFFILKKV